MKTKLYFLLFLASITIYSQNPDVPISVPTNGLLAYYPFNGNANDESGNGRNGTVTGAVLSSDRFGNANSAYTFNASSLIEILNSALLDFSINDFTISAWVNYNPNPNSYTANYILSKGTSSFLILQNGVGFDTYGKGYEANSNSSLVAGSWFHVVCVKNSSGYIYYINNSPLTRSFGLNNTPYSDKSNNLKIGGKGIITDNSGALDDIALWNRALTPEEITNLYSSKYNNPYTSIPDVNFEKKLIALGIDSGTADGKVLTSSISSLTSLNVSSSSITNLTGIEDFSALTNLNCSSNQLANLDVTKNVALKNLNCYYNRLTNLDVTKNSALTDLNCGYNQLVNLDLSKNVSLASLTCSTNQLASLDFSKNVALTSLNCYSNQLASLDLSKNVSLAYLYCSSNQLASLDLSKNVALTSLDCSSNQLASLDVSKNLTLSWLWCDSNQLVTLDVSKITSLKALSCDSNQLRTLNLKNGNNTILSNDKSSNFKNNPNLSCIQVDNVAYSNANWSALKDATASYSTNCTPYTLIPDLNFEKKLIALGIDSGVPDGKVPTANVDKLTSLDVSNSQIADLTGIQDFVALETLSCNGKGNYWSSTTGGDGLLKTLDISKNTKLITLNCSSNQLKSLDISSNTLLKNLDCRGNVITSLDVSKNMALEYFSCYSNKLTSLDLTKNAALISLICYYNQISSLNFTANTALTTIECYSNKLVSLDVSKNTALTFLNCSSNQLSSLDVSKNASLKYLNCYSNQLSSLDVSKNVSLTSLEGSFNQLKSLDLSKNVSLSSLGCSSNQLASLDISKSVSLTSLGCSSNQLTSLDLSKNISLAYLTCSSNRLTSLDFSKNVSLADLTCSYNQLTSLDFSKNVSLTYLDCSFNSLSALNLKNGKNTLLYSKSNFTNNPNLSCIQVDDVAYSNANWTTFKDATASFNDNCFSLPSDNFAVESKGESCLGEKNGEINITAKTSNIYVASINGTSYPFSNNILKVGSLVPGIYIVSINVAGENFDQSFKVTISKGATITGKSSIALDKVNVEITEGTAPYTVFVDGVEQFKTTDSRFSVETKKGDLIEVKTAKACEGIYAEDIAGIEGAVTAHPNPTSGNFEIELPTAREKVAISLYALNGTLISNKTYTLENGKAQLTLENQAAGVYIAKIELNTPVYLRIIK
ncbi:LamG-like jellyroll fold domain-containing protein, partial [Flavobacterium sp.]|uniref:LamG-like jellyroll fold domain-containing protein n=1 Tax=Flavobacterium sp. TaxID=239 RepID=UPI002CAB4CD9